jgi:hypothetical protein
MAGETKSRHTYLIQRLEQPHRRDGGIGAALLDALAFGGGGSGLSRKAHEALSECFSFDYMGAAEFEFGALPKSLEPFVHDHEKLRAYEIALGPKEYADGFARRWKSKGRQFPAKPARPVYLLCREGDREYVESVVRSCALNTERLKEPSRLVDALDRVPGDNVRTCGWYELDNGFFFFTDREMWQRTCALFGVEAPIEAARARGEGEGGAP